MNNRFRQMFPYGRNMYADVDTIDKGLKKKNLKIPLVCFQEKYINAFP